MSASKRQWGLTHLVLDFNGTLACDGKFLPGVRSRLSKLSKTFTIIVVTSDTFGTVRKVLNRLPVQVRVVAIGREKARFIASLNGRFAAIGNGRNDIAMFRRAALAIAVLGPEGLAADLISVSSIVVGDIREALDLLMHPKRLKATLRP